MFSASDVSLFGSTPSRPNEAPLEARNVLYANVCEPAGGQTFSGAFEQRQDLDRERRANQASKPATLRRASEDESGYIPWPAEKWICRD
jgi:hypothetical protein